MLCNPIKLAVFHSLAAVSLATAGCSTKQVAPPLSPGLCNTPAARRLVGKVKPTDAEAMRLTGATIVRQIAPGDPVIHDLRGNRVTIATDPASGRVVVAMCG